MSEQTEVDSAVRGLFQVRDAFLLPDGEMEYKVSYGSNSKENFVRLCSLLSVKGMYPHLSGTKEDATLTVRKVQPRGGSSRIPVLAALLTVTSVAIFSLLETAIYQAFAPQVPVYAAALGYGTSVVAILSVHEFAHRYLARRHGASPSVPYFVPGIPNLTAFLPTLGVASLRRDPLPNRDRLFDLALVGPLAALVVTVALYIIGEATSVVSVAPLGGGQLVGSFVYVSQINPSVAQFLIDTAFGYLLPPVPPGYFRLSPLMDGATVGFLLTFLSVIPLAFMDGGEMVYSLFGERALRVTTYLSILALVAVDTPNYLGIAILFLVLAGRRPVASVLDEVSETSRSKKLVFLVVLVTGFLCLPIPQNLATLPLG